MNKFFWTLLFLPTLSAIGPPLDKRWLVTRKILQEPEPMKFGTRIRSNSPVNKSAPKSKEKHSSNIKIRLNNFYPSSLNGKSIRRRTPRRLKKKINNRLTNTTYTLSRRKNALLLPNISDLRQPKLERHWEESSESVKSNLELTPGNELGDEMPLVAYRKPYNPSRQEDLGDCKCFWNAETCGCECQGTLTGKDFQELSQSFQKCANFTFTLAGGHHHSLPPHLFTKVGRVQNFRLHLSNSTFDQIFDPKTPSPFEGVTAGEFVTLHLSGVGTQRGWNWTPLENLNGSTEVRVEGCGLKRLASDFSRVAGGGVRRVVIRGSGLQMIGSGAFASFQGLESAGVPRNKLKNIRRDVFPEHPMHLVEIDLRDNQLSSLEEDLFADMPSLLTIFLAGNPLRLFAEPTFSAVIGKIDLQGLSDFPLYCDCNLRWLKNTSLANNPVLKRNLKGVTCRRPPHLRGMPFLDLAKEHLICK